LLTLDLNPNQEQQYLMNFTHSSTIMHFVQKHLIAIQVEEVAGKVDII